MRKLLAWTQWSTQNFKVAASLVATALAMVIAVLVAENVTIGHPKQDLWVLMAFLAPWAVYALGATVYLSLFRR